MTAVELLKKDLDAEIKLGTKMVVNWDMYLEMEKQQIIKTGLDCGSFIETEDMERYYNETYGSKGSDKVEKSEKPINLTSSQTEISDEEIEKASENSWSDYEYEEGNLYSTTFKGGWKLAIKWYREQLKKKQ